MRVSAALLPEPLPGLAAAAVVAREVEPVAAQRDRVDGARLRGGPRRAVPADRLAVAVPPEDLGIAGLDRDGLLEFLQ